MKSENLKNNILCAFKMHSVKHKLVSLYRNVKITRHKNNFYVSDAYFKPKKIMAMTQCYNALTMRTYFKLHLDSTGNFYGFWLSDVERLSGKLKPLK